MKRLLPLLALAALSQSVQAGECTKKPAPLKAPKHITGAFHDDYGSLHVITEKGWQQITEDGDSSFAHKGISHAGRVMISKNSTSNPYHPGKWSRFEVVKVDGKVWFCQSVFDAADEPTALATPRPDDSDPATTGCGGGFPWSELLAP